jgi:hypothetical protein
MVLRAIEEIQETGEMKPHVAEYLTNRGVDVEWLTKIIKGVTGHGKI